LITSIRDHLNPNDPLDTAVFSCLTTLFFTCTRIGEFTIPQLDTFDPNLHVKPSNIRKTHDRQGLEMTNFHLLHTKTALEGEDVFWAKQFGASDPEEAFRNHLSINEPPAEGALFSYHYKNSHRPLTKSNFLKRLANAMKSAGLRPLQGHGIRISRTLEYLL
jgi:hypothetical protein